MLQASLRMRRESWKGFHKMSSRNVLNTFTVAGTSVELHKGLFLMKRSLNNCIVLYFSEIKWFREHFESSTRNWLSDILFRYVYDYRVC